jgi:hypothetical protein
VKRKSSNKLVPAASLAIVLLVVVTALAATLVFISSHQGRTGVVISEYDNTPSDGCAGYELKDGTTITTFCFWSGSKVRVEGDINVGDTVEYDLSAEEPYIKAKE